eukprot:Skav235639  [mRNA]  locus=scaffold358:473816:480755:- [translate_table: standard]
MESMAVSSANRFAAKPTCTVGEEEAVGSLRDLEEALAELAEQNDQLEEDCRDLEASLGRSDHRGNGGACAHCRDLERLGYPSPCPVEQLLEEVSVAPAQEAAVAAAVEAQQPDLRADSDARVQELLKARDSIREKSFATITELQERCSHQQNAPRASRRARKKRNLPGFRQAKCLDEGVEVPQKALLRASQSGAPMANSLWYELIIFLLDKAGEDDLPTASAKGEVRGELQSMAYQIQERISSCKYVTPLKQLGGSAEDDTAGVLESVLKSAFDSAVLFVDQKVSSPPTSPPAASGDVDRTSETFTSPRGARESIAVSQESVATFKQIEEDKRSRLRDRIRRQRSSVLSDLVLAASAAKLDSPRQSLNKRCNARGEDESSPTFSALHRREVPQQKALGRSMFLNIFGQSQRSQAAVEQDMQLTTAAKPHFEATRLVMAIGAKALS